MNSSSGTPTPPLVAGVDTHTDTHALAILTAQGGVVFTGVFPADERGYAKLIKRINNAGNVGTVGVEGTNSYGAGLTRALTAAGYEVREVLRPTRQIRRLHGKSDGIDAVEAARTVLSNHGISIAKDSRTPAESLRCLLVARNQLITHSTALGNSITSLLITAPEDVRSKYRRLSSLVLAQRLAVSRPNGELDSPATAITHALKQLAKARLDLKHRADELECQLRDILIRHYPQMLNIYGAGTIVAAQLVVTAGGNPQRIRNEAAFASLCGVAPIPASSGRTNRHRLNRGGDRRGNSALHRIAFVRLQRDERTKAYAERRMKEGKSRRDIMRCLKRAIAREAFRALTGKQTPDDQHKKLKALRKAKHLTQRQVADALGTHSSRISEIERQSRPLPELPRRYQEWLKTA